MAAISTEARANQRDRERYRRMMVARCWAITELCYAGGYIGGTASASRSSTETLEILR